MDYLYIGPPPLLRNPTLLLAFEGWNDASSAATSAARFIRDELGGREYASIGADPFYNFQETRPEVHLDETGRRVVTWPANTFYACETPQLSHDIIAFVGVEPHLKWKAYIQAILSLIGQSKVKMVVTLGALLADVYHRNAVRISGSSSNEELAARLHLQPSRYEGPTGIVGVLNDTFQEERIPAVSVWANVPHYVNVSPNPKAALALVRRLSDLLSYRFDVAELEFGANEFDEKIDRALELNNSVQEYVKELKSRSEEEEKPEELPSGEELAREVERYLREHGKGKGSAGA